MKKLLLSFLFPISLLNYTNSQWHQTNSPMYSEINSIVTCGDNLFVGTHVGAVHHSTDNGETWEVTNMPISFSLAACENKIYTAIDNKVHMSEDNGNTYTTFDTGLPSSCNAYNVVVLGDILIMVTEDDGCIISRDHGSNWDELPGLLSVSTLLEFGDSIIMGTSNGLMVSADQGLNWDPMGLDGSNVISILLIGQRIVASTYTDGLFVSDNRGNTWEPSNTDLSSQFIGSLDQYGQELYLAAFNDGVFRSEDNGTNWEPVTEGLPVDLRVNLVHCHNGKVLAGTSSCGIFILDGTGTTWSHYNNDLGKTASINALVATGDRLIAGTSLCGLYTSDNRGDDWTLTNLVCGIYDLYIKGDSVYAGTTDGVYFSNDDGTSWKQIGLDNTWVTAVLAIDNFLYAGIEDGVRKSVNHGTSWTETNTGIPNNTHIYCLAAQDEYIYAGSFESGVYRSDNSGSNWTSVSTGLPYNFVHSLFVDGPTLYASVWWNGVYRSNDNGTSWNPAGLSEACINEFAKSGDSLIAATWQNGIYSSHDQGDNWNDLSSGLSEPVIESMALTDEYLFIGMYQGGGMWKHTLSGPDALVAQANSAEFLIFPNPAQGRITIYKPFESTQNHKLRIYNTHGILMVSEQILNNPFSFDISGLRSGIYLFQVQSENGNYIRKVVVE